LTFKDNPSITDGVQGTQTTLGAVIPSVGVIILLFLSFILIIKMRKRPRGRKVGVSKTNHSVEDMHFLIKSNKTTYIIMQISESYSNSSAQAKTAADAQTPTDEVRIIYI